MTSGFLPCYQNHFTKGKAGCKIGYMPNDIEDKFKEEIRKQSREKAAKWTISGLIVCGAIAVIGWWGYFEPILIKKLGGILKGAVLAFDAQYENSTSNEVRKGCPTGFMPFEQADGKFLIGATPNGSGVGGIRPREVGGDFSLTLTASQLPGHNHSGETSIDGSHVHGGSSGNTLKGVKSGQGTGGNGGSWVSGEDIMTKTGSAHSHRLLTDGGVGLDGTPIEVKPPYVGIYFCIKFRPRDFDPYFKTHR